MDIEKRISKAKTSLVLDHPFVGTVAMSMPFKLSEEVPTAATNGKRVLFNPKFCEELTDEELQFLVAHECMHPMLEHNFRRGERDLGKWNRAADYVINKLLVDERIGKMPSIGLHDENIYQAGGGTSDGIYNILPEQDGPGGGPGGALDDCEDGEGNQSDQSQQAVEWRVKVAQAAQAAKMMGKLSAGMERFVDEILNPKVDWREVLQRFVEKCRDDRRSFARPNRRFIGQGLYIASPDGEAMGEVAIAVDCSGSIGAEELNQFAAELRTIQEEQKPKKMHVLYFDSEVSHHDEFDRDTEVEVQPHGGGGTAFSPVFRFIEENGIEPSVCVFLTDMYCSDFGEDPGYPVLWVAAEEGGCEAPFGETVFM